MTRPPLAATILTGLLLTLGCGLLTHCSDRPSPVGQNALAHTGAIVAFGPRPPGSPPLEQTRAYITSALHRHGWVTQARPFTKFTPKGNVDFTNLVARYAPEGDTPELWNRPVKGILGAHIDSKHFEDRRFVGADDAASAVGVILEIAASLAPSPSLATQLELAFFDGEEAFGPSLTPRDGLYGSRHYAAHWRRRDQLPSFGIILDMIGHKNLSIRLPNDTPAPLSKLLFEVATAEDARRTFTLGNYPILDDHVPLNDIGIPTIDIIGDFARTNWWHTPRDTLDLISPQSLDLTHRVTLGMLQELLR